MELMRCNPRATRRGSNNLPSLFDDFLTPFFYQPSTTAAPSTLAVDIFDREGKIILEAEIPGVQKDDIQVNAKGKTLTISAERKIDEEVKDENRFRRERRHGKLERSFSLPFAINEEHVEAKYDNGVLILTISKPEEEQKKQIQIQ